MAGYENTANITSSGVSVSNVRPTRLSVIRTATHSILESLSPAELRDPSLVESRVLEEIQVQIDLENQLRTKGHKWRGLDELLPTQIADILAYSYPIVSIMTGGAGSDQAYDLLGIYQEDGPEKGIYSVSDEVFRRLARKYCYTLTIRGFDEMMSVLRSLVPRVYPCREKNLIAVNNGIFDYDTKTLLDFSPDYVFLSKSKVNYNTNAKNVVIHNSTDNTDWDVESWLDELFDDKSVVHLIWQILGAIIRPNVPWGQSAWFYSESGNNGKGTLCELMRQLCGDGTYTSISLADFSKDFMLEPLTHSSAIITDENDVGTYIDKAANLKAVVTGDAVQINRKFKQPISYQFHGFMVQCLNEMPRIKDRSDSFFRRQIFIPFVKCFTGAERKYIKQDYLHRQEVLEYVMLKVLHMNYYSLDVPVSCQQALEEYKEFNDPIRQFLSEMLDQLQWDLVPFSFLYDLYGAWYKKNYPGRGELKSSLSFSKDVVNLLPNYGGWYCEDKRKVYRPSGKMDVPEPLIGEYDLKDWMNPRYVNSKDEDKRCMPVLKSYYRGILRAGIGEEKEEQ